MHVCIAVALVLEGDFFGRTLLSFGLETWIPTMRVRGRMNMKRAFFFLA